MPHPQNTLHLHVYCVVLSNWSIGNGQPAERVGSRANRPNLRLSEIYPSKEALKVQTIRNRSKSDANACGAPLNLCEDSGAYVACWWDLVESCWRYIKDHIVMSSMMICSLKDLGSVYLDIVYNVFFLLNSPQLFLLYSRVDPSNSMGIVALSCAKTLKGSPQKS